MNTSQENQRWELASRLVISMLRNPYRKTSPVDRESISVYLPMLKDGGLVVGVSPSIWG